MSLSRRDFIEAGALSASGLVISQLIPNANAEAAAPDSQSTRTVLSMNAGWQFFRPVVEPAADPLLPPADASWQPATLPHTVRLEQKEVSGGRNYQGLCWYKKKFSTRPEWQGQIIYLKFQGAMQVADVWLNDAHLRTHYGGYTPFTLDISKAIRFDHANTVLVRLDNRANPDVPPGKPQSELDFCYFGGLYRDVDLEVRSPVHITDAILANKVGGGGIFVTFPSVDAAESTVHVQTDVLNERPDAVRCAIEQKLLTSEGKIVASGSANISLNFGESRTIGQDLRVASPRLWHPNDPYLYRLNTAIVLNGKTVDEEVTTIGIRSVRFEAERGLLINGEPFFSIGANRHQDHPYVGNALPRSAHYRDAYKLREAGFTSYRSHYPQDPAFMNACDELGILAVVSNPGWQFVGGDLFKKRACQGAREMIRRDRNHPSVIIWEAALNESDNSSIASELYRIVHEEFPGSACYASGDPIRNKIDGFTGWDVEYVGGSHQTTSKPGWIREWGDQVDNWTDQQGRVRVARCWGETPMLVQAAAHLTSLDRIYGQAIRPSGADLWSGIDSFRGYHHQAFLGAPLDVFRLPKFDYYMFQSQRPPLASALKAGNGPAVFIANYGTFHSPTEVTVFSNCEEVRLTQNGAVIGTQRPDSGYHIPHPPFTFKVGNFSPTRSMLFANPTTQSGLTIPVGELMAEGLIAGKVVATHTLRSPGVPACIHLRIDSCGVEPVADGSDWIRVYAHICDARGETYPYSDEFVSFSVSGEGALIGDDSIDANPVRAEAGIATALVQMSDKPGKVTVRASSPSLKSGEISFRSIPANRPFV